MNAKYYVDEFYEAAFIGAVQAAGRPALALRLPGRGRHGQRRGPVHPRPEPRAHWFDAKIVDGLVNLVAWILQQVSLGFRKLQSGRVQNYAFVMFLGFIVFAFWKFLA